MTTAININKFVRKWVQSSGSLLALCPLENIKPLVLPPNKFPFVSYVHSDITPMYTKDGLAYDEVDVLFAAVSDDYETSINILEEIRGLLEEKTYEDSEVSIPLIRCKSISEDYIDNAYIQMIVFTMHVVGKQ